MVLVISMLIFATCLFPVVIFLILEYTLLSGSMYVCMHAHMCAYIVFVSALIKTEFRTLDRNNAESVWVETGLYACVWTQLCAYVCKVFLEGSKVSEDG